jgi:Tetratricopeptide repeat
MSFFVLPTIVINSSSSFVGTLNLSKVLRKSATIACHWASLMFNRSGDSLIDDRAARPEKIRGCLAEVESAPELKPTLPIAYCGLGDSLAYEGRVTEAIPHFEKAISLRPYDPHRWAFYSYGALAHLFAGQFGPALDWAQKATRSTDFHSPRATSHARIRWITIPREVLAITLVFVAVFGSGCDVVGPTACTLIGCTGLVVEVTGAPRQTPVTVVVTAPNGATRSSTCISATGTCPVSFPDFTRPSVTIRVSAGTQTTEETREPMYEVTRPNGPACPPECRSARVTVAL